MKTPYSDKNQKFSDLAHISAQEKIYPLLFNARNEALKYTSTSLSMGEKEKILDGEMAIDRLVKVKVDWFRNDLEFAIQERFREKKFASFRDVTITEWNNKTNLPSELFKIHAGIFLYGYFDTDINDFIDWIAFDVTALLHRLVTRKQTIRTFAEAKIKKTYITRSHNERSGQDFLNFRFDDLEKAGVVLCRK